jgi:hypothetical protein
MKSSRLLAFAVLLTLTSNACKTVSRSSETLYANNATDLSTVKKTLCVNYVKTDDCLLRLHGYEADTKTVESFKLMHPKYYKILADYGSDFAGTDDPSVNHILSSAKKYKLSESEMLALATYMGPNFSDINSALRGNKEQWADNEAVIYNASSALTHLKSLLFKGKVFRSEKTSLEKTAKLVNTYKVGNIVVEQPFLSTTTNETLRFAESDIDSRQVLLRYTIVSKSGVSVSDFSPTKSEDEVLFAPGTVFKVVSFSESKEDIVTDEEKKTVLKADTLNIGLEEIDSI